MALCKDICKNGHELAGDNLVNQPGRKNWRRCRICLNAYHRARRATMKANNPESLSRYGRSAKLKENYGITLEDKEQMWKDQDGKCKVCDLPISVDLTPELHGNKACVDHDHETKIIRGLLCHSCNRAIGLMGDSPEILDKAAAYLRSFV